MFIVKSENADKLEALLEVTDLYQQYYLYNLRSGKLYARLNHNGKITEELVGFVTDKLIETEYREYCKFYEDLGL